MSEFAQSLNDLAKLCGKSEYQLAQYSGLDPSFVQRLFDAEKRAPNQTIIWLANRPGDGSGVGQHESGAGAVHPERPQGCATQ